MAVSKFKGLYPLEDTQFTWAGSFVNPQYWKELAVNLDGLAFSLIPLLTPIYVMSQQP